MLIKIKDNVFILQFEYEIEEQSIQSMNKNIANINFIHQGSRQTMCKIIVFDSTKKTEEMNVIGEGLARCNIKDNFVRDIGRKISLERAIKEIELSDDLFYSVLFCDNDFRKEFWKSYLSKVRKPKVQRKNK